MPLNAALRSNGSWPDGKYRWRQGFAAVAAEQRRCANRGAATVAVHRTPPKVEYAIGPRMFPKSNLWEVPFTFLVPSSSTRTLLPKLYSALRRGPLARERATLAERGGSVGLRE